MNERPILTLSQTRHAMILNGLAIAGLVALCVVAIHAWSTLPDRFPTHFGFDGKPNGWGGKATLLWLPLVGLATYILLTILVRFPQHFNYAVRITEANAARQYQIACSMLAWLKTEMVWIYAYLEWQIMTLAIAENPTLGIWFLPVSLILVFGTVGFWIWQSILAR